LLAVWAILKNIWYVTRDLGMRAALQCMRVATINLLQIRQVIMHNTADGMGLPYILTLCRSNLNPYCLGSKAAFFSALRNRLTFQLESYDLFRCLYLDHVYTPADMLTKLFHHVRQHRATFSFAQRNIFMKRTASAI
jgi:hypothetical protein